MDVYKKIGELQAKLDPDSCAYEIGEQLQDICRRDPACEKILLEGLQNTDMGLAAADKMLYDWGRNHKVGNCCGISGRKAGCCDTAWADIAIPMFPGRPFYLSGIAGDRNDRITRSIFVSLETSRDDCSCTGTAMSGTATKNSIRTRSPKRCWISATGGSVRFWLRGGPRNKNRRCPHER